MLASVARWLLPAILVAVVMPSGADAATGDVAATHAYIEASYALGRAGAASIPAVQAQVRALNGRLAQRCPRAGAGSGQSEATQPMAHEVASVLWTLAYGYNARAIAAFVAKVDRLRWSDPRITRLAAREARGYHAMATLPRHDLCADVQAWAASGFTVIPPGVVALDDQAEASNLEPVPERLLAPYERGSDAKLLALAQGYETKVGEAEFVIGQADWFELLGTLALNQ
jgi:hypothetical protein